jgi:allantoicase
LKRRRKDLTHVLHRPVEVATLAKVVIRFRVVGLDGEGLAKACHSLIQLPQVLERNAAVADMVRLRVYGRPHLDWSEMQAEDVHELSALKNGGRVVAYNDAHYGDVWAVLSEGRGVNMGDGWETRRRREPGNDWMIIALGAPGAVEAIEVDTAHFKGNYPDRCSVQAARVDSATDADLIGQSTNWVTLMEEQPLSADSIHRFEGDAIAGLDAVSHVRLNIHPDGGVSRFRVFGKPSL